LASLLASLAAGALIFYRRPNASKMLLPLLVLSGGYAPSMQPPPTYRVAAARASVVMAGKPWETANVPRGKVSMNPLENLVTMQDQRVASCSHINLAPGKCTLPLEDAKALMEQWKSEIGSDINKFAERAKTDSHCSTAANGGDLGFVVRKNLCQQFDDILFSEEPGKAYGPIVTTAGLHLIFLKSCREPTSRSEAALGLPFSIGKTDGEETK